MFTFVYMDDKLCFYPEVEIKGKQYNSTGSVFALCENFVNVLKSMSSCIAENKKNWYVYIFTLHNLKSTIT